MNSGACWRIGALRPWVSRAPPSRKVAIPIAAFTLEPGWTGVTEQSFQNVFLGSQRMILASLTAYIVAQFVDIGVFHLLKRATQNRFLWLRATGSTAVSQLIDTIVINIVAWTGILGVDAIVKFATGRPFCV